MLLVSVLVGSLMLVPALLDSGAQCSVVTKQALAEMGIEWTPAVGSPSRTVTGAGGAATATLGTARVPLSRLRRWSTIVLMTIPFNRIPVDAIGNMELWSNTNHGRQVVSFYRQDYWHDIGDE